MFRYDMWKYQEKILELGIKYIEEHLFLDVYSLVTKIDYTVIPPIIDVGSPQMYHPDENKEDCKSSWDENVEQAKQGKGHLFFAIIPRGRTSYEKFCLVEKDTR
jgi:hypothetical protein